MKDVVYRMFVHWRPVRQLEERVPHLQGTFDAIQRSASPALVYPDGSLEHELHPDTEPLWMHCMNLKQAGIHISFLQYGLGLDPANRRALDAGIMSKRPWRSVSRAGPPRRVW
jgi:hypothetical protein